ncbi:hypothetical protein PRIPAC_72530, partial [Pristionchus pacificus]|uniref:Uncharacterized protein n=1 Tax=Pristionchus pacificus TaxID=54126 RepID=A0A2A6C6F5_PRIPA
MPIRVLPAPFHASGDETSDGNDSEKTIAPPPSLRLKDSVGMRVCIMDTLAADCINITNRPSSDATHFTRLTGGRDRHASVSWTRLMSSIRWEAAVPPLARLSNETVRLAENWF